MAALAPVRYPVVVGVIAFGLLNPDPVYAPTFQTTPEDRPSVLETAGETGLAIAVGAIGIKIGQAGSATDTAPRAYSVAFETRLALAQHGPSRGIGTYRAHFAAANKSLLQSMTDPELAAALRQALGENFEGSILRSNGSIVASSPEGWTWHHVPDQPGVLQLVPRIQHATGSIFQPLLHPNGVGGMYIWGSQF